MRAYKLSDTEYLVPVPDYTAGHVADGYARIGPDHPDFNAWTPFVVSPPEDEGDLPPLPPKAPKGAGSGRQPVATEEQRRLAFHRWEQLSLRRLARSEPLDAEFDTRHLDELEMERIRAGLANCTTAEEIRAEFQQARDLSQFTPSAEARERQLIAMGWRSRRIAAEREAG
jgi:hypothetical protein